MFSWIRDALLMVLLLPFLRPSGVGRNEVIDTVWVSGTMESPRIEESV
jgi:hypothetical protein